MSLPTTVRFAQEPINTEIRVPHEVSFARNQHLEGLKFAGQLCVLRRKYRVEDLESGEATRCSVCYSSAYEQAKVHNCTSCYGTSFTGGYYPAELIWAILSDNPDDTRLDKRGIVDVVNTDCRTVWYPQIKEYDVVMTGDIDTRTGLVRSIEDRYLVGSINPTLLRIKNVSPIFCCVQQYFKLTRIIDDDIVYQLGIE